MNFCNDLTRYSSHKALLTEGSGAVSYQDLLRMADTLGGKINKRSLVFVVCKNHPESIAGYIGFMRAGSVSALISNAIHQSHFANLLTCYRPEYIYLPRDRMELVSDCIPVEGLDSFCLVKTLYRPDYLLHDDLALLLTTSGSTGSPKFVRLSHKNLQENAKSIASYLEITSECRPITTMPMNYSYGLSIINSHLLQGAALILNEFTLMEKRFWKTVNQQRATTFGGVPYTYEMLRKLRFERINLPSLRYLTQAGGKLSRELSISFSEMCRAKGIRFYVMYGQTEATARMSYLPWEFALTKAGSIGKAIPGGQFWLKDETGNMIQHQESTGELVYQGDNVALGYAESFHDLAKGDENNGILHTGDMAQRDADGFYSIVGRKNRFLKMYGHRINLDEVEQLMREKGLECACSGTDDHLRIYVTQTSDPSPIKDYITERTSIHPSGLSVLCVEKIPRHESGKVLYAELDHPLPHV